MLSLKYKLFYKDCLNDLHHVYKVVETTRDDDTMPFHRNKLIEAIKPYKNGK